ncbi:MAG TPA: hypothetical protein VKC56_00055 [Gallionellaceae bacterium]|nr:hypothetical protein [Gallionellaceae bacterium]
MEDPIDVLLAASEAHSEQIAKLQGMIAALGMVCTALAEEVKLAPNPDASIEKLKTSFLFSKLPDAQVQAANRMLELVLKPPRRNQ